MSQCIELLCGSFADNEIEITCGDGGVMHADFVAQVIDRYIRPFAKDSLRQLFLYGFVAWRTESVEKGAYRAPVIVDGAQVKRFVPDAMDRSIDRPPIRLTVSPVLSRCSSGATTKKT